MNYVDDGDVIDDLLQLARKANGQKNQHSPKHIQNSGASIDVIGEFRTDIFLKPDK
jgi:hypothetical protein